MRENDGRKLDHRTLEVLRLRAVSALRRLQKLPATVRGFFADPCLRYITA